MKFTFPPESKPLEGYTIKRAIHRGGFGEVYYALSEAGKEVALKLLQQNMDVELRGVRQCLNLKHPNLVTIFDIRTDGEGDHWIVMEYVSGRGLDQTLAEHPGGLPIEEVRTWLSGMVAGLSYLHDRGIVHRDLKPANVYREHDQVKIGDVGLSKFISESQRGAQTQSVGTVYYMAPEVAHGRYGREVDVYALGVMLYEMLTGRVPFDGETAGEILMKHLSEKADLSAVPKRLRSVVAHALEKDPLLRTAGAAQLEEEFNQALRGVEIPRDIPEESFAAKSDKPSAQRPPHAAAAGTTGSDARHAAGHAYNGPRHCMDGPWQQQRFGQTSAGWPRLMLAASLLLLLIGLIVHLHAAIIVLGLAVLFGIALYQLVLVLMGTHSGLFVGNGFSGSATAETRAYAGAESPSPGPTAPPPQNPAPRRTSPAINRAHPVWSLNPDTLRSIPLRQRMMDLSGSLTFAVFSTVVITAGLTLLQFLPNPAAIGLFGLTTLLAAWALLVTSKLREGTRADGGSRRLALLVVGAVVGAGAFFFDEALMVNLPAAGVGRPHGLIDSLGASPLYDAAGPTLLGYVVFFGGLFGLRRWWWHADAFRARQYRVSSALLTALLGYFMTALFAFPHTWGILWAVAISSVVQLSAVWVPPEKRAELMEARSHGQL